MVLTNTQTAQANAHAGFAGARLEIAGLSLARGGRVLFEGLNFEATSGGYVEIKGANGSGKTSLLRAVAGLLKPRAGRIAVSGPEAPELALHLIGHRDGLKPSIDARAHLRFWSGLLGGAESLIAPALERVGLASIARLPTRAFSQGQARRLSLARLLVAPRPIWVLDEPAAGLDAQGRALLASMIEEHRKQDGIVIAAVHDALGPAPTHTLTLGAAR